MNAVVEFKCAALAAYDQLTAGQDELRAAAIKKFGILEPLPDDGQTELFS